MCGIAGLLTFDSAHSRQQLHDIADAMNSVLRHRGPDDEGVWVDADAPVALAHRRLSIVDLSPAGHQPMISADGRFVITYNGEIYNHEEIRPELAARGIRFRGYSDTEVMLEAFSAYGIAATVKRLIGMFAFGVWDRRERTLTLVRDRLGIKPMYWAKFGALFMFGSELKALRAHPGWAPRINRGAVAAYLRHNYIPTPHTIYEGVHKLEPGSILTLPWGGEPRIARFWDARAVARAGLADPLHASDRELTDRLEELLKDSVRRRMIADVPVGAFLSGGIDSSTVVALMQAANAGKVKTYTIGFDIAGFNEAKHAAAVAKHLRTEHTELTVTAQQALDVIPRLPDFYDEPFADSSQIPTYLVSAMTRRHVTVALSGDGGDELFAGYNRYQLAARAWHGLSLLPRAVRHGMAAALTSISAERWSRLLNFLPARMLPAQFGDKLHKFASVLNCTNSDEVYRRLVTHWEPDQLMSGITEPKGILWNQSVAEEFPNLLERMQFLDLVTYLPDDILTKVDRASMAVALEARVPLLDHRVVEFAWRLPSSAKIRNGNTKWLLRQVLDRHVPRELIERPKMGFGIPLGEWLRGPLRDWAEALLSEKRLREAGLLDAAGVRQHWDEHLQGHRNWQHLLWDVLMLEAWRERWATPA
jgi:asparagine synthase (glutamine-hydrolysing)